MQYPFTPKSTTPLRPGQFWPIALSNGRFACGRVLQIARDYGEPTTKMFLAGLMDWTGAVEPDADALTGRHICEAGSAHVKTITHKGGSITGLRDLHLDGLAVPLFRDAQPGPTCHIREGFKVLRPATPEEQRSLPTLSTWGFEFIDLLAEDHFGAG